MKLGGSPYRGNDETETINCDTFDGGFTAIRDSIREIAVEETGDDQEAIVVFVSGDPNAGKSFLSKKLGEDFREEFYFGATTSSEDSWIDDVQKFHKMCDRHLESHGNRKKVIVIDLTYFLTMQDLEAMMKQYEGCDMKMSFLKVYI